MPIPSLSILLIGDVDRPEFADARASLDALGQIHHLPDDATATAKLAAGDLVADAIVVAQAYPGQFSRQAVERMARQAPLARVLGLLGSWCEGEMRTGRPWPAATRIYWHQWASSLGRELRRLDREACPVWGLPVTATEEERLLAQSDDPQPSLQGLVAIHARRHESAEWLAESLRGRGCSTVWLRPPRPARVDGATAALFDGTDCRGREPGELTHLAASLGRLPSGRPVPIVALLDFPRIEDQRRALQAGAAAVVTKPLHIDDLFWQLDQLSDGIHLSSEDVRTG